MLLAVTHMHALAVRAPLVPPISLSPTAESIMYSEGIIPPSLPLFLTHVHPHPSHHERGMDGVGLINRGNACQMKKYCLLRLSISFDVLFRWKTRIHFITVYSSLFCPFPPACFSLLYLPACLWPIIHGKAAGCTCVTEVKMQTSHCYHTLVQLPWD